MTVLHCNYKRECPLTCAQGDTAVQQSVTAQVAFIIECWAYFWLFKYASRRHITETVWCQSTLWRCPLPWFSLQFESSVVVGEGGTPGAPRYALRWCHACITLVRISYAHITENIFRLAPCFSLFYGYSNGWHLQTCITTGLNDSEFYLEKHCTRGQSICSFSRMSFAWGEDYHYKNVQQ